MANGGFGSLVYLKKWVGAVFNFLLGTLFICLIKKIFAIELLWNYPKGLLLTWEIYPNYP